MGARRNDTSDSARGGLSGNVRDGQLSRGGLEFEGSNTFAMDIVASVMHSQNAF